MPKFTIPKDEYISKGHSGCSGCGATLLARMCLKALGPKTIINTPATREMFLRRLAHAIRVARIKLAALADRLPLRRHRPILL